MPADKVLRLPFSLRIPLSQLTVRQPDTLAANQLMNIALVLHSLNTCDYILITIEPRNEVWIAIDVTGNAPSLLVEAEPCQSAVPHCGCRR